ncbi:MAG: hypothetical protein CXB60_02090 [Spiroplasma poulsonii]|nr:hypothetical protein [Spiroplasma poulsonii]
MELINYLEKITDEKVYLRGVNLYRKQKVKNLIITSENNEEIITKIKSNVEASNNFTKYNIFLLFSKKTLIDYSCDCIYFLNYNNFCKHLVATFLDYHSKIISSEKSNLSIDNNFSLSNLLISKYKEKSDIYFLIKNKYILNYNIVILYDKIAIELEIYNNFNKKTYKVRNIIKLLWAYIEKEIYKFTNNFIIDFKYSDFIIDKNNKKIWEIILNNQKMVDDFSIYNSDFFNGPDGFISSNQFMKILYSLKGQNINIKHKSYYNSENLINYYISEKKYNFNFKFSHNDEILNLEINNYSKLLIDDLPILIENNILYLITFDQLEIYKPIYELLKNKENKEIIFEINNLKNVAHYLLPNLKLLQNDLILPKTIEKNIINQELEVNFHLDYENNKIIIFLSFKYGNYIFNLDNNFNPELPKDYILIRNELKEKNIEEYLLMSGFKKNDNIFYLNNDDDNYINFITKNIYELKKLGAVYYSKNFKNIKFISQPQIKIIIKNSEKNLLDFSFKINNISDNSLSEIFSSINNKKEYYHLKNGSILELKDNKNNKFYKLLETLDFDLTNKK